MSAHYYRSIREGRAPCPPKLVVAIRVVLFVTVIGVSSSAISADLIVSGSTQIVSPSTYDSVVVLDGGTLIADAAITVTGGMTVASGGSVVHSPRNDSGLVLDVTGTLDVQLGGLIDLNGLGLRGGHNGSVFGFNGEAYDITGVIVSGAQGGNGPGAGASYGGVGGNGTTTSGVLLKSTNVPYGLIENPVFLGSGGGGGGTGNPADGGPAGGNGGGRLTITAGTCVVNGTIRANGENWKYVEGLGGFSGGGSGGSILIDAGSLTGGGTIQAIGGEGTVTSYGIMSGSGGGGRIAIFYESNSIPHENVMVQGGGGGAHGTLGTVLLAGPDLDPATSSSDTHLILSPAGNIPFSVTLRDASNQPIAGSNDCWLDFSNTNGLVSCASEVVWPRVYAHDLSDPRGIVRFFANAGGCTSDSIAVMSTRGVIAKIPVRSLDQTGGLIVTTADFTFGQCNDYDDNGSVDGSDWDFFVNFLDQNCFEDPARFLQLQPFTNPGPEEIYQGDTIQVCCEIFNPLERQIILDSVIFSSAGWGIARPWSTFEILHNIPLPEHDSTTVCQAFIVPYSDHGCFRIQIYPRPIDNAPSAYSPANRVSSDARCEITGMNYTPIDPSFPPDGCPPQVLPCPSGCQGILYSRITFNTAGSCDGTSTPSWSEKPLKCGPVDPGDIMCSCKQTDWTGSQPGFTCSPSQNCCADVYELCVTGYQGPLPATCVKVMEQEICVCEKLYQRRHVRWTFDVDALGYCRILGPEVRIVYQTPPPFFCDPPAPPPPGKDTRMNRDARKAPNSKAEKLRNSIPPFHEETPGLTNFSIPIGEEYGSELQLKVLSFLPLDWHYSISQAQVAYPPETLAVTIYHPDVLRCEDFGRIVVSATDLEGNYAGDVDLRIYPVGNRGDLSGDEVYNIIDVVLLVNYIYRGGVTPVPLESGDASNDGIIDVLDIMRLIDYVFRGGSPIMCP